MTTTANQIRQSLEHMFDFQENYKVEEKMFSLYGSYYQRNSQYFAVKKAELYSYSNFEHLFFIDDYDKLEKTDLEDMCNFFISHAKAIVKPDSEHMSSVITLIFECEHYSKEVESFVKCFKYNKSYKLGLNGWTQIKLIVIATKDNALVENKAAKGDAKKLNIVA